MALTIWRFPLKVERAQTIEAPAACRPLHVGRGTDGSPALWALVNPDVTQRQLLVVEMFGTGSEVPDATKANLYLGTVVMGDFVWHYFLTTRPFDLDGEVKP